MNRTQPFQQSIHHQMKEADAGTENVLSAGTVTERRARRNQVKETPRKVLKE